MFQIIAEALSLAAHASMPRGTPARHEAPPARPTPTRATPVWPRQG